MKSIFEMKWNEKIMLLIVFVVVIYSVYIARTDLDFYQKVWTREDGFIENLSVFALFLGAMTAFYRAKILAKFRSPLFVICLILMGLVFIFGMGEEISWGQRIFDWKSPAFFQQYNTQGETNFHNLKFGGTKINKLIFGTFLGIVVGFYFLILPVLFVKIEKVKNLANKFAIPVPKAIHIFAYILLAVLAYMIPGHKKGEILEFGGCWIFYIMTLEPLNRERFSRVSENR